MKKKITLALMLSAILIVSACSQGASGEKEEKISIEYWHVNAETQGGKAVEELVNEFNQSQNDIEVISKYNPDMYKGLMQNLQAEVASGKSPAVIQVGWSFMEYFSSNFSYTSPTEVIDAYFPEDETYLTDNFLENILDLAQNENGDQVGIPYSLSTPVLYINKDLLKEAGLDENGPQTWEEVQEFSKVIRDTQDKYGLYIQEPNDNWATQALLESNGAKMIEEGKATFASKEGIEAYELWTEMIVEDKSAAHLSWDEGIQSFIDGNVAMAYTTIARRSQIQENVNFDVAAVKSPVWEGKDRSLPAGGAMLAITAEDEETQKAAWEFMKFLYSVESMATWTIDTGYVPPRKGVATSEKGLKSFLEENEMMNAAIEQMDGVVPWASFPGDGGLEAEQKLLDIRDQILGGEVSVEKGLKKVQEEINEILK